jgi:ribosome-associated protein YbcJ (S4-like RNA binding protein)
MNIGSIVSTVQSEPLELPLGEEVLTQAEAFEIMASAKKALADYEVLVNEEITPEIKEDIFA